MIAKYLWIFGSLIITVLGTIHLVYTFLTNKFLPRDEKLENEMKMASPILTRETTMWKAWIGFNASHSSGAMFIGLINLYLAVNYFTIFQSDNFFFLFNILTIGFYAWLAKKYWFKIPLTGIIITFICFIISYILTIINK
jgi:hypothetical protein